MFLHISYRKRIVIEKAFEFIEEAVEYQKLIVDVPNDIDYQCHEEESYHNT
jgi:hypothetical protein